MAVEERRDKQVQQCRKIGDCLLAGNWRRFFVLQRGAPFCVPYLCELFRNKVQMQSLLAICRVSNTVTVASLQRALDFPGPAECLSFIEQQKGVLQRRPAAAAAAAARSQQQQQQQQMKGALVLDCKASLPHFEMSPLLKKKVHAMG
ncbi:hypothetical protein Emed_005611 [Eimeria media]